MSRKSSVYLFCLVLIITVFCSAVPCMASSSDRCSAAKEKYMEGVKLRNYEARRAAFQKAVDLCPSYAEAHVNLADALEHLGRGKKKSNQDSLTEADKLLDEAAKHYSKALELKHSLVAPKIGLADIYMLQGRFPLAVESYEKIFKTDPETPGLKDRLEEAKCLANSDPKNGHSLLSASEITKQAKNNKCKKMDTMGIENYTVADKARQSFNNILFDGWSSTIKPGNPINQLDEIGKALSSKDMTEFKFVIEGHANKVGEYERNMNLSNDRAHAVKDYLVEKFDVDPNRIITQGFGYTRPKHSPDTNEKNRRVEVVFVK